MTDILNLYDLPHNQLVDLLKQWGEPRFRADQLWQWLYKRKAPDFASMHTLPAALRERLAAETRIGGAEVTKERHSTDGETRKYLLRMPDGQLIETVLMEYSGVRRTACISTQAGCALGCVFCATGQMGFARNLTAGEIIEQVVHVGRVLEAVDERLSNVVLMGMGEPFHNYDATMAAVRRMIDPEALAIGQRHVTVSTVGLAPEIRQFAQEDVQVRLAISLHAATDRERSALLPINRQYPLDELLGSVRDYIDQTNRRVTFEWALIAGENDSVEQAHTLGKLLKGLLCHLNVIPLNATNGYKGRPSHPAHVDQFVEIVEEYGIPTTVRVRRGIDIHAGCGQLKASVMKGGG
ncbi:MAG: 23S rRNA (adenine(2503)-C(2))-methyltransferase RlmN [Anaerolineae bacterium]|nr:23S rRNA (adenine(2503)-C(2))-methyltransferase RlmN [Anaerolineae bacterium]